MRRSLALVFAGSVAFGLGACGLTADFDGLQGGVPNLRCEAGCDVETGHGDASPPPREDASADSAAPSGSCPSSPTACSIMVTKDTFDLSYDGYITYVNNGMADETNPAVTFTVPDGVMLYTVGCAGPVGFQDQGVPSTITALSCSQSGSQITYAFTGTLPPGSQIALYYTTSEKTEAVASCITVTATSCP